MKGGVSRADERTITVKFEVLKDHAITEAHGDADIEQAILEAELSITQCVTSDGRREASSGEESCKACPSQEGGKKACARQEGREAGTGEEGRPAALTCLGARRQ